MGVAKIAIAQSVPFDKGFVFGEVHVACECAFEALALEFGGNGLVGEV